MKKILIGFLCALALSVMFLSAPRPALAGPCDQTLNTGINTTIKKFYEDPLAYTSWSGGTITNDMYFNGCGETVTVKINTDDWERLRQGGKLDGLRYIFKKDNSISLRKMVGTTPTSIASDNFFDSTSLIYTGNK